MLKQKKMTFLAPSNLHLSMFSSNLQLLDLMECEIASLSRFLRGQITVKMKVQKAKTTYNYEEKQEEEGFNVIAKSPSLSQAPFRSIWQKSASSSHHSTLWEEVVLYTI